MFSNPNVRGWLYVALMVVAVAVAIAVVFFDAITADQVTEAVAVASAVFAALVGLLARLNTPAE